MKKVYLETFGCQMNVSDSERIKTHLSGGQFEMTDDEAAADVILFNTCSVREKAEHKLQTRIGQVKKNVSASTLVGVLGCVAQLEGENLLASINRADFVVGTQAVGRINSIIQKVFETGKPQIDLNRRESVYDWSVSPAQRHSEYVAFVPIIEGCNKFCTYCIVPFSRGRERSLPAAEILAQIEKLKSEGVREVHLIGQNVNSYRPPADDVLQKFSGATAFSRLLRAVAATGIERVKFTTSFPRDFHPDIVSAIEENGNLCNWIHLPVQSGSDRILSLMRRGHTIENYRRRIARIRESKREIALTTDVIIGFPGETDEDFQATLDLYDFCQFDSSYIFKYSPRPGTPAAELADSVDEKIKTGRFLALENRQRTIQERNLPSLVGKTFNVLAESQSPKSAADLTGHSTCHRVVNFRGEIDLVGRILPVKIESVKKNSLYGSLV